MKHKRSYHSDVAILRWLQPRLTLKPLQEINREVVQKVGEEKRSKSSPSTANRVLALLRAILRRCEREWEWIDKAPMVRLYRESKRRVRWLTPAEFNRLLVELPEHQREVAIFAVSTGLRQSNVMKLEWLQVNLEGGTLWIFGDQAKAGRDIHVSLNETALAVLRRQQGKHPTRVFTYKGKTFDRASTHLWMKALKRAGIENFRWHDLRHTWASWLAQQGVPLNDIQEMGAWETTSMVRRYAHLSPAHLVHRAKVIDGLINTNLAQVENPPKSVSVSA
jgi:integrase